MSLQTKVAEMLKNDSTLTPEDIAAALGVSVKRAASALLKNKPVAGQPFDEREELERLIQEEIAKSNEAGQELTYWEGEIAAKSKELHKLIGTAAPSQVYEVPVSKLKSSETIPILMLSDWLLEVPVKTEQVMGLNAYDLEIGQRRVSDCVRKFVKLLKLRRLTNTRIETAVVWLGGGFIAGKPGESNPTHLKDPAESSKIAVNRLYSALKFILKNSELKKIIVPCTAGSISSDPSKAEVALGNPYEWCIYSKLAKMFKDDRRIEFYAPKGQHIQMNIFGKMFRYHYGDSINYRDGVGGLTIPLMKRINAWNVGREAYMDIFGRWRTYMPGRNFVGNGSLIGYTPTAAASGTEYERPMQALIYIEKEIGLASYEPIFVE